VAEVKEAKEKPEREAKSGGGIWATMSGLQKSKGVNVNAALSRTAWYPGSLASWHPGIHIHVHSSRLHCASRVNSMNAILFYLCLN